MKQVKCVRCNTMTYIPEWYDWLEPVLTIEVRAPDSVARGSDGSSAVARMVQKPLYVRTEDRGALFLAGYESKVIEACTQHGISVTVCEGRQFSGRLEYKDMDHSDVDLRFKQLDVLNMLAVFDKGIVNSCTGYGKTFVITRLCKIFYKANIVIVTRSLSVVNEIYEKLCAYFGKNAVGILKAGSLHTEASKRIVVSTVHSMLKAPLKTCDLFIFDEVHNVGNNQTAERIIEHVGVARMFGFTASLSRGDQATGIITGLFGEVIARVDYAEAVKHNMVVPLKVYMPPFCNTVGKARGLTGRMALDKRLQYWTNYERNLLIANINNDLPADQQALISVDTLDHAIRLQQMSGLENFTILHYGKVQKPEKVWSPFTEDTAPDTLLLLPKRSLTSIMDTGQSKGRDETADIVLDEAMEFRKFAGSAELPACYYRGEHFLSFYEVFDNYQQLVYSPHDRPMVKPAGTFIEKPKIVAGRNVEDFKLSSKERDKMKQDFSDQKLVKVIATMLIKEGINVPNLRYITRADGGTSEILGTQIPGRASRLCDGKQDALLIDPFDTTNWWTEQRSKKRRDYYKKMGWKVL